MRYIPTEWHTGDLITAEKLNKIETGVTDINTSFKLVKIHEESDDSYHLNYTWQEISEAILGQYNVYYLDLEESVESTSWIRSTNVTAYYDSQNELYVVSIDNIQYSTSSSSEYPVLVQ